MGKVKEYFLTTQGSLFSNKKDAKQFAEMTEDQVVEVIPKQNHDDLWTRHLKILSDLGAQITKASEYRKMVKEVISLVEAGNYTGVKNSNEYETLKNFVDTEFTSESK